VTRKLLICQWFGEPVEWHDDWLRNFRERLDPQGYDLLLVTNERWWATRAKQTLGVRWPGGDGRKACDYRACFGVMFGREISLGNYQWWGHTDLDCVYGRVEEFMSEELLSDYDLIANHHDYVSGPWTLYRRSLTIDTLYQRHEDWRGHLENPETTGWVETSFTKLVDEAHNTGEIRRLYGYWQTENLNDFSQLSLGADGRLMENGNEVMMAHFRRTKIYPEGCR